MDIQDMSSITCIQHEACSRYEKESDFRIFHVKVRFWNQLRIKPADHQEEFCFYRSGLSKSRLVKKCVDKKKCT